MGKTGQLAISTPWQQMSASLPCSLSACPSPASLLPAQLHVLHVNGNETVPIRGGRKSYLLHGQANCEHEARGKNFCSLIFIRVGFNEFGTSGSYVAHVFQR